MKRIIYTCCFIIALTLLGVWWFGTGNYLPFSGTVLYYSTVQNWTEYLIHFGSSWFFGIVMAAGVVLLSGKILRVNFLHWKIQNYILFVWGVYLFSLLIGAWVHHRFFTIFAVYEFLISYILLGGVIYLLYRIAEAVRHPRTAFFSYKQTRNQRISLILKFFVTGIIISLVAINLPGDERSQLAQWRLLQRKWFSEKSDIICSLTIKTLGISHTQYLDALADISRTLTKAGVKVIVAPLPEGLGYSEIPHREAIEKIAQNENVVFAIPVEDKNVYPPFSIGRPVGLNTKITMGAISAVALQSWWQPFKYYPLSYWEYGSGDVVPDVAVEAVRMFSGNDSKSELTVKGRTFSMPGYQSGLMKDHSSIIQYRIIDFFPVMVFAKIKGGADSVEYAMAGSVTSNNPTEEMWRLFKGKIILVEPGYQITKLNNFSWIYGNIIHNILQKESTLPLDAWTPLITGILIVMTALLILSLNPLQSLLSVLCLGFGQHYLYNWLATTYSVIVEPMQPIVGTVLGLFAFSFILIAHERKLLEGNEKKRILEELQTAHDMQMGLMPTSDPVVPRFDVSGVCHPAYEVGGDYFDYIWLDEEKTKFGIAIADVSGKAMKAAMTAVMTSGMVYRGISSQESPRTILQRINRPIYLKTDRRVFTAMSFTVIDITTMSLTFSNAGQMTPLLRRNNILQSIKVEGPRLPLGVREVVEYNEVTVQLQNGDILVLFTDGLVEAMNNKNELWGFERMEQAVKSLSPEISAQQMAEGLIAEANRFAGTAMQHDDMTIVVVRVL